MSLVAARFLLLLAVIAAGTAAAAAQLLGGDTRTSETVAAAVTEADVRKLSDELGRPIFWLGPASSRTLELSRTRDGKIFLRYLPASARVGGREGRYPTVATYPVADAYAVALAGAERSGGSVTALAGGAALITYPESPRSAYYVERRVDVQVEVYDPRPGRAARSIRTGELQPVPTSASLSTRPHAATVGALEALPEAAGHPVYWAGARAGVVYELTRMNDGRIFVRYLPPTAAVGDAETSYLTIATYPGADVFETVKAEAESAGARIQALPRGRLLIRPRGEPRSAYLIAPREEVQVEVYAPQPGRAAALIASGAIVPLEGR